MFKTTIQKYNLRSVLGEQYGMPNKLMIFCYHFITRFAGEVFSSLMPSVAKRFVDRCLSHILRLSFLSFLNTCLLNKKY